MQRSAVLKIITKLNQNRSNDFHHIQKLKIHRQVHYLTTLNHQTKLVLEIRKEANNSPVAVQILIVHQQLNDRQINAYIKKRN